jgi:hypothetical protein
MSEISDDARYLRRKNNPGLNYVLIDLNCKKVRNLMKEDTLEKEISTF